MNTRDQEFMDRTEISAAIEYAEIAAEYNVPTTLFITGRTAVEEPKACKLLSKIPTVEIGGHNHLAYTMPVLGSRPYNAWKKAFDVYSPAVIQRWDVRQARSAISNITDQTVVSWRDHAYRHDRNTPSILVDEGIQYFSDEVNPNRAGPYRKHGLTYVPINTLPDHEHLYHGYRTKEYVQELDWENAFTDKSFTPDEWINQVLSQVHQKVTNGETVTVLAHPGCMDIVDGLETFEKLCSNLAEYEPGLMRDLSLA